MARRDTQRNSAGNLAGTVLSLITSLFLATTAPVLAQQSEPQEQQYGPQEGIGYAPPGGWAAEAYCEALDKVGVGRGPSKPDAIKAARQDCMSKGGTASCCKAKIVPSPR